MERLTKKINVAGSEMVMCSLDGRSWFLNPEAMVEYEKRLRQTAKVESDEIEELEPEPIEAEIPSIAMHKAYAASRD